MPCTTQAPLTLVCHLSRHPNTSVLPDGLAVGLLLLLCAPHYSVIRSCSFKALIVS